MPAFILTGRRGAAGIVMLNRPMAPNAWHREMRES